MNDNYIKYKEMKRLYKLKKKGQFGGTLDKHARCYRRLIDGKMINMKSAYGTAAYGNQSDGSCGRATWCRRVENDNEKIKAGNLIKGQTDQGRCAGKKTN
jgi:hypothetical protein